jgi:hypothetical protein
MRFRLLAVAGLVLGLLSQTQAAGWQLDAFASSDADGNDSFRSGLSYDLVRDGIDNRRGIKLEHAEASGEGWRYERARAYLRLAATADSGWKWRADIGTDGRSLLGNAALISERGLRRELFLERDIVETRLGVERSLYHSFLGGTVDIPLGSRLTTALVGGVQDFGGSNRRLHARAVVSGVLVEDWGLSTQLRLRYFDDSVAGELDYFAPGWYREALAGLSLRRFVNGYSGRLLLTTGRQQSAGSQSRRASLYELQFETPKRDGWYLKLNAGYSNTPISSAYTYAYRYLRLEFVRGL